MACHSCGVEKSSNFDEKEHLVSQSHYNSHFACLALNSDKKIVAGSSLTHKNVISPNFSAIVQALDGTLHVNIPELANAWLEHTKKTYHNTFRETHTPHNAMLTLRDTIFEFGSIALPCTSCDNHLLRTSGIALNHSNQSWIRQKRSVNHHVLLHFDHRIFFRKVFFCHSRCCRT